MAVLRVILFLLELLGILVLAVLGLLLLVVLLVLLTPVRYKGKLKKQEEPEAAFFADVLVSWLNPLLRVRIRFLEGKLRYTVRLFGICFRDSEKQKSRKPKKRKKKKQSSKKQTDGKTSKPETTAGTELSPNGEPVGENGAPVKGFAPEKTEKKPEQTSEKEKKTTEEDATPKKKESFFATLKKLWERVLSLPARIKEKVRHIGAQIKLLCRKKEAVFAFLEEESHLAAIGRAMKALKKLLVHVLPRKLKGSVVFGTGDPESTGKALAALGILYAAYGKEITIAPDFNEKRLTAELVFRGRIRFGTLLVILLRLMFNQQIRGFYKDWKQLAGLLKERAE